jgi:hypothetical protein
MEELEPVTAIDAVTQELDIPVLSSTVAED